MQAYFREKPINEFFGGNQDRKNLSGRFAAHALNTVEGLINHNILLTDVVTQNVHILTYLQPISDRINQRGALVNLRSQTSNETLGDEML